MGITCVRRGSGAALIWCLTAVKWSQDCCDKQCVCCDLLQEVYPSLRSHCQDGGCHLMATTMEYSHVQDLMTVSDS